MANENGEIVMTIPLDDMDLTFLKKKGHLFMELGSGDLVRLTYRGE